MNAPAPDPSSQALSTEWREQWTMFRSDTEFLFHEWIAHTKLEDFRGLSVLEGGCGSGQHTALLASTASKVTAVDLNTTEIAAAANKDRNNVRFVAADLATMDLGERFDAVVSVGVIHHTDDPDRTFDNLYRHLKPGGRMVIWTYSAEGNALVRFGVEPLRKLFLTRLSRRTLVWLATAITALIYPATHGLYRLPFLSFLPFYEYFALARRLSFHRHMLNVFDKLNAPQTHFTHRERAERWFSPERFEPGSISILRYAGVSYSLAGIKRAEAEA